MKLPYAPKKVFHKHGGRVLEITAIGHALDKARDGHSRDYWHYFGRVKWNDGTGGQRQLEIAPWALCADCPEGQAEINELSALMNEYLAANGTWSDKGPHRGWYAHRKKK